MVSSKYEEIIISKIHVPCILETLHVFFFADIISAFWDSSVNRLQISKCSENFREKFHDAFLFYHGIVKN